MFDKGDRRVADSQLDASIDRKSTRANSELCDLFKKFVEVNSVHMTCEKSVRGGGGGSDFADSLRLLGWLANFGHLVVLGQLPFLVDKRIR